MNYLTLIKDNYHLLSKNEKKVADYILNNSLDAYDLSIGDLAEKSGTVRSCVMRFTKKIWIFKLHILTIGYGKRYGRRIFIFYGFGRKLYKIILFI